MWHVWRGGDVRERGHLEDISVDGRIILKLILKSRLGDVDWIDLAQYRDRWRAVVSAVMNRRLP
jgi:hypothetical protein